MSDFKIDIKITENDMGFDKLIEELTRLQNAEVKAGFIEGQGGDSIHNDSDLTNASLATIHEYGSPTSNIPPRPIVKQGTESVKADVNKTILKGSKGIFEGTSTANDLLEKVGEIWEEGIKGEITSGNIKPTKNGDKALFKTGELHDTVTYKVDK